MPDESASVSAQGSAPSPQRVRTDLQNAGEEIGATAEDIRNEALTQAENVKQEASNRAKGFAAGQKDHLAQQLAGVSDAVDRTADELDRNDDTHTVAGYAHDLAGGIRHFSETVRSNDVDSLVGMAQDFGRRQPLVFLGAAALVGFAASRFLMASAERRTEMSGHRFAAGDGGATTNGVRPDDGSAGRGISEDQSEEAFE